MRSVKESIYIYGVQVRQEKNMIKCYAPVYLLFKYFLIFYVTFLNYFVLMLKCENNLIRAGAGGGRSGGRGPPARRSKYRVLVTGTHQHHILIII